MDLYAQIFSSYFNIHSNYHHFISQTHHNRFNLLFIKNPMNLLLKKVDFYLYKINFYPGALFAYQYISF